VKLRLFQRYIESDVLCHGLLPPGCFVATIKLYPSRTKSSVIGSRDYRHVPQSSVAVAYFFAVLVWRTEQSRSGGELL
jgi:hypothetical protein